MIPIADLRRQLGVVLQDTFLFSGNVADNLRLNAEISDQQLAGICRDLGLNDLLQRLPAGLETELRSGAESLIRRTSAAGRGPVAIRNPTVLVMDEATAFMDPATEATCSVISTGCCRNARLGRSPTAWRRWRPRIGSGAAPGELIEQGTHLDLRARGGLYAQLAELQEKGLARL